MNDIFDNLLSPIELFYKWEKETPDRIFLRQPIKGVWKTWTYAEAGQEARKIASGIIAHGISPRSHVAIISKNCAHWILSDLAIMMAGCVSVPLYANLTSDQLNEVLIKSDSVAIFVGKLDEWAEKSKGLTPNIKVFHYPQYPDNADISSAGLAWEDLLANNSPLENPDIPDIDSLWTILFTSGTTGTPKGVMHTHKNAGLIANNELLNKNIGLMDVPLPRFFSFLPLNHIAERAAVQMGAIMSGGSMSFAESLDTFAQNLRDTKPTFFFAVPRIWTKFQLGVLAKMPPKKLNLLLSIPIVSGIIKKKIKANLGLDECTSYLTGASITPESLKQWYRRLGINLREVYGMTENGGGFTTMPKEKHKPDTVGKPISNAEGKIVPETGEILMKMPWMMTGYYKDPELTAESLVDGWLHTGDKGKMDHEGFISVIGRVKDAFKTGKGEFIVPTVIEDHFSDNEFIEQICVAGLTCPQPVALVCLSEIGQKEDQSIVTKSLETELVRVNQKLQNHEKVSTIIVAKEPWTDTNKLLTPTLKIKRGAINEKYGDKLLDWHETNGNIVWEN
jgi:long-chain acyl-CoA synthetase